jgi:Ni/Co efflux regulator RcnB
MKLLIHATLALCLLALAPAMAQRDNPGAGVQSRETPTSGLAGAPQRETSGGDKRNPEPHTYRLGEHLSEAYGAFELVDDWERHQLKKPPGGHHWARYGENFLLVTDTDGLITLIVSAS